MTTVDPTPDHRADLIADLRAFADLLERRPDLPLNRYADVTVQYSVFYSFGNEASRIAEVERVAAILGVEAEVDERRATAKLDMGRVTYVVNAGTDLGEALYDAEHSYAGAVEPDMAGAR